MPDHIKKRLEEELRIARVIQMSLLPTGPLDVPGLGITALCVLVALVLGGLAAAAASTAQTGRSQGNDLLDHVGPLRIDAGQLLAVPVDQESRVRGFAQISSQTSSASW